MFVSRYVLPLFVFLGFIGCSHEKVIISNNAPTSSAYNIQRNGKIAIIVPLSGDNSHLGNEIVKSCLLALKQYNEDAETIVIDSGLIDKNLSKVVSTLRKHNVEYVVGPVFGKDASLLADAMPDVMIFSLSNNTKISSRNLITFGLSPEEDVKNLVQHAVACGCKNILTFLPSGDYGDLLSQAINKAELQDAYVRKIRYNQLSPDDVRQQFAEVSFDALLCLDFSKIPPDLDQKTLVLIPYFMKSKLPNHIVYPTMINMPNQDDKQSFIRYFASHFSCTPSDLSMLSYDIANVVFSAHCKQKIISEILDHSYKGVFGEFYIHENGTVSHTWEVHKNKNLEESAEQNSAY